MNWTRYVRAQAAIVARLTSVLMAIIFPYRAVKLEDADWVRLLAAMYPHVEQARRDTARLAREYYDFELKAHFGPDARHNVKLPSFRPEWFEESMEHVREEFSKPGASESSAVAVLEVAAKLTENAGRKTVIRAVESWPEIDEDETTELEDREEDEALEAPDETRPPLRLVEKQPRRVRWARVATGAETCSWCLMLVSRGPVYRSARTAGLQLDHTEAVEVSRQVDDGASLEDVLLPHMNRWHDGCDCKVVPVFDENWSGRDQWLAAEALWKRVTKGIDRDKINAFRRAVENGELDDEIARLPKAA